MNCNYDSVFVAQIVILPIVLILLMIKNLEECYGANLRREVKLVILNLWLYMTAILNLLTYVEITEMKQRQEALGKANTLLRLAMVVRYAYNALVVQDLDGRILAWNPGADRMYGWSEAEALTMNHH